MNTINTLTGVLAGKLMDGSELGCAVYCVNEINGKGVAKGADHYCYTNNYFHNLGLFSLEQVRALEVQSLSCWYNDKNILLYIIYIRLD
jgi:hypothetical protein